MEKKDGPTSIHLFFFIFQSCYLWRYRLIELGRRLDKTDRSALLSIAEHLKRLNQASFAAEIYRRLGDSAAVLHLHVEAKEWAQAFLLVQNQPQFKALVYVPYAHWLAENDKFVQAQKGWYEYLIFFQSEVFRF